jgi:hypothetical protein
LQCVREWHGQSQHGQQRPRLPAIGKLSDRLSGSD